MNLSKSSTAEWQQCTASCKCSNDNRCKYSETYSEGSAISGHWFTDRVRIGDSFEKNNPVVARMGCHDSVSRKSSPACFVRSLLYIHYMLLLYRHMECDTMARYIETMA